LKSLIIALPAMIAGMAWCAEAADRHLTYVVRDGEMVGHILVALGICKIWGKGNLVERTLRLNHTRISKGGELRIRPARRILLPFTRLPDSPSYDISPDGTVRFTSSLLDGKCGSGPQQQDQSFFEAASSGSNLAGLVQGMPETPLPGTSVSTESEEPIPYVFSLGAGIRSSVLALQGTQVSNDSKALLVSGFNLGFDFVANLQWSGAQALQLELWTAPRTFDAAVNRRYRNNSIYYSGAGLTYFHESGLWGLTPSASLGYRQNPFYHSETQTVLQFDSVGTPYAGVGVSKLLSEPGKLRLLADFAYQFYFPVSTSNYGVNSGSAFQLGGKLNYQWSTDSLFSGQLRLFSELQNTSILNVSRDTYEIRMMYVRKILK
jgi:hypothetical protein